VIEDLINAVSNEAVGAVAGVTGRTEHGTEIGLEILLLPLAHAGHARIRAIGALVPIAPPYWLGEKPVVALELSTLRYISEEIESYTAPQFAHPTEAVQLRHGFVVYSGGRELPPEEKAG
jgi:hypothetical protein